MMYKKSTEYSQREALAALSALNYHVEGVERITEKELDVMLHAFLKAAASARRVIERRKPDGDALASIDAGVDDFPMETDEWTNATN